MAKGKNKFLDWFKFEDDEYDEEEDEMSVFDEDDDEDDDDDYGAPRESAFSSFIKKKKEAPAPAPVKNNTSFMPKQPASTSASTYQNPVTGNTVSTRKSMPVKPSRTTANNTTLVSVNTQRRAINPVNEVFVIKPKEFDDAQTVSDFLKNGKTIIINMEGLEFDSAQRIIDFIGGACYGLGGDLEAISSSIFIAAPSNIEVTGDLRDEIINGALSPQLKK